MPDNADSGERYVCLAVVGSTAFAKDAEATKEARRYIEEAIDNLEPDWARRPRPGWPTRRRESLTND